MLETHDTLYQDRRQALLVLPALIACFLLALSASGQSETTGSVEVPDTLAGQRLTGFLAALNSGDEAQQSRFLAESYVPSTDRTPEQRLEAFQRIASLTGGVRLHGEVRENDESITALVQNLGDGLWVRVEIGLESAATRRITAIALEVTSPPAGLGPALDDRGLRTEIEQAIRDLGRDDFSGAVQLSRGGEVLFEGAYGLASRRFDVPNLPDTRFNIGSMNKMFTAVAIARLVEDGKLSFDDALVDHLPDIPRVDGVAEITVHHLLTHTSGLGSYWEPLFATNFTRIRSHEELLKLNAGEPLAFAPGDEWAYSNTGYVALGRIIEVVTGKSYFDYVREAVFEPAGMRDTDSWAFDEPVKNLATGYTRATDDADGHRDGPVRSNVFLHAVQGCAAGGGYSTVGDLHRFARALWGGRLLRPETLRRLHTPAEAGGRSTGYGYGFGIRGEGTLRSIGHNGGAPGISAEFRYYPELDVTLAVLSNVDGGSRELSRALEALVGRLESDG